MAARESLRNDTTELKFNGVSAGLQSVIKAIVKAARVGQPPISHKSQNSLQWHFLQH